ncbi:MAG: hypothetical protein P4L27_02095 [Ignavibacteriaceae bacterium]|nr:hypothetical protein [Ignavibacteriaceae bacterium]
MKIYAQFFFICGLLILLAFQGFPQKKFININDADSSNGELILAEAGNKEITVREFIYGYEFGPAFPKRVKNSKEVYLNYLINEKLLAGEGYSRHLDTVSIVKENLYGLETDMATEEMFKDQIMKQVKISDKEISEAVNKKLVSVELKWLFAPNRDSLNFYLNNINKGVKFDSLFNAQLINSVFADQRSWKTDLFNMEQKSSMIAGVVKNQKAGAISSPVEGPDGWYIFKIVNVWKEVLPNESEIAKLKEDSQRVLEKDKMDSLSDNYIKHIFVDLDPQIDGKVFYILRLYLAKYKVSQEKFSEWNLEEKLINALSALDSVKQDLNSLKLVNMKNGSYSIKDFIDWLRYRDRLLKFNDSDFNGFSGSVESFVWRMVRDNSLTKIAFEKGYQNKMEIQEKLGWWKDKIMYALIRDNIINSVPLKDKKESFKYENDPLSDDANKKLLHTILALKQKNKISINKDLLNEIKVENENDPRAIEVYTVKKDGIFPHPAYPSIDLLWQNWQ